MRVHFRGREYLLEVYAEGRWGFFLTHVLLMGLVAEVVGIVSVALWLLSLVVA